MNVPESWTERLPFLKPWKKVGSLSRAPHSCSPRPFTQSFWFKPLAAPASRSGWTLSSSPSTKAATCFSASSANFCRRRRHLAATRGSPHARRVFHSRRQVQGTAFCLFFFFEQFLPISVYMADARAQELPLLTVGDTDKVIHDWNYLFTKFGVLDHDTQIAQAFRIIGWIGMLATVAWMAWRSLRLGEPSPERAGVRRSDVGCRRFAGCDSLAVAPCQLIDSLQPLGRRRKQPQGGVAQSFPPVGASAPGTSAGRPYSR